MLGIHAGLIAGKGVGFTAEDQDDFRSQSLYGLRGGYRFAPHGWQQRPEAFAAMDLGGKGLRLVTAGLAVRWPVTQRTPPDQHPKKRLGSARRTRIGLEQGVLSLFRTPNGLVDLAMRARTRMLGDGLSESPSSWTRLEIVSVSCVRNGTTDAQELARVEVLQAELTRAGLPRTRIDVRTRREACLPWSLPWRYNIHDRIELTVRGTEGPTSFLSQARIANRSRTTAH